LAWLVARIAASVQIASCSVDIDGAILWLVLPRTEIVDIRRC
jgi:hypothetical protein